MAQRRSPRLQPRFHPARHRFAVRQAAERMTSMKSRPGDVYAGAPGYLCNNGSGSTGGGCRDGSGGLGCHCERSYRGTSGDDDYCGQYSRDANVLQFHQRYLLWQREVHVRLHAPTLPSSIASCMPPPVSKYPAWCPTDPACKSFAFKAARVRWTIEGGGHHRRG